MSVCRMSKLISVKFINKLRLDTSHKISVIFMLPMSKFRENGDHIELNLAKNRENTENDNAYVLMIAWKWKN